MDSATNTLVFTQLFWATAFGLTLWWIYAAPRGFLLTMLIATLMAAACVVPQPFGYVIVVALIFGALVNLKWRLI